MRCRKRREEYEQRRQGENMERRGGELKRAAKKEAKAVNTTQLTSHGIAKMPKQGHSRPAMSSE